MFRLVVESGPHARKEIIVAAGRFSIGRDPNSTLVLDQDPTVSRKHLAIDLSSGSIAIQDLGSTGGTVCNGKRVIPNTTTYVRLGDQIHIGNSVLSIRPATQTNAPNSGQAVIAGPPPSLNQCSKCRQVFLFIGARQASTSVQGYCNGCAREIEPNLQKFANSLQIELRSHRLSAAQLSSAIDTLCHNLRLPRFVALRYTGSICRQFLQQVLAFALSDSILTDVEEHEFYNFQEVLGVQPQDILSLLKQIEYFRLKFILSQGILPVTDSDVILPPTEIPRWQIFAVYFRDLAQSQQMHDGILLITSSRILFTETDYPFEVSLSKVVGVSYHHPNHINLQLSRKQGSGFYQSEDALCFVEVLRAALDVHLRATVVSRSGSRVIPQDVKAAVWQRDDGMCVQCGAMDYLEFDHVIPYSKGGATSFDNLQLLCRNCNLIKGDRI